MKILKSLILSVFLLVPLARVSAQAVSDVLELRIENPYFSPNKDSLQDNVFFTPILKSDWNVSRWRLEVLSDSGKLVYRTTGAGFSTLIQWNGTDRKGAPLPEGVYRAVLYGWGEGAKIKSAEQPVVIDDTPPLVELSVSTAAQGSALVFHPRVQESNSIDRWMIQFVDLNGKTLHVAWSSGSVSDVRWPETLPGQKSVAPGPYKAVFQAWDKAGNESSPVFVDFTVNFSGDRSVRTALRRIHPHETPSGVVIQFPSKELFGYKSGKPVLSRTGLAVLEEAALLINAYPQCSVRLDGYSFAKASAAGDRDLGSLSAWTVYSYLVKQGSVQASRLTVRGRGRVVAEERDRKAPLILKNGVEIWLLGAGPW